MTGPLEEPQTATTHGRAASAHDGARDAHASDETATPATMHDATHDATHDAPPARDSQASGAPALSSRPTLRLQEPVEPRADGRYHLDELLAFHDRAFVESAYAAALGRAPFDAELSATLADLRAARRDKREIVAALVASEEGARVGAARRVAGLDAPGWKQRVRRLPVVGYLWQLLAALARLPVLMRHQREFETYTHAQQQRIAEHLNAHLLKPDEAIEGLRREINDAANDAAAAVSLLSDALARICARQADARAEIERALREGDERRDALASDIAALRGNVAALETAIPAARDSVLDAQQEYLAREQQAIVEAEKAVLTEIEGRFADALASQRDALAVLGDAFASLSAHVAQLETLAREGEGSEAP